MSTRQSTHPSLLIPGALQRALADTRARIHVGFPWWLRPWLARDVIAITLGRTIYLGRKAGERSEESLSRLLRHELAHVRQVNRLGLARFLWRYVREFFTHLRRERSVQRAYRRISFEVEAEAAEQGGDV